MQCSARSQHRAEAGKGQYLADACKRGQSQRRGAIHGQRPQHRAQQLLQRGAQCSTVRVVRVWQDRLQDPAPPRHPPPSSRQGGPAGATARLRWPAVPLT